MTTWTITIAAPTGAFDATLHIREEEGAPVGEMSAKAGRGPMRDLTMDAGAIAWSTRIERPLPMTLSFRGEHDGEAVTAAPVRAGMWVLGPGCLKWTLDVPCYILPCCHRAAGMHLR